MTKEIENDFNMPKFLKDQIIDKDGKRKIDDKSIEMLTDYTNNVMPQTKDVYFKDGKYTKERQKLHKDIIDEFKGNLVCIQQDEPIAILMGGSPASGKSTFLRKYAPYLLDDEILRIDADEVRSQLPEYDGWNASATHLETKDIVNTLLSDRTIGLPCEYDIIYDGTMNNTKAYLPLIKLLRKLGYKIYVVYIDNVPKPVIEKRVKERYQKSGRFVPLEVVDDFFSKGKTALNEIKKKVDGYMVIDGSDSNYRIIEEGGMKLPKSRKYSQIGTAIDKMATGGEVFSEQIARGYDVNLKSGTGTYDKGGLLLAGILGYSLLSKDSSDDKPSQDTRSTKVDSKFQPFVEDVNNEGFDYIVDGDYRDYDFIDDKKFNKLFKNLQSSKKDLEKEVASIKDEDYKEEIEGFVDSEGFDYYFAKYMEGEKFEGKDLQDKVTKYQKDRDALVRYVDKDDEYSLARGGMIRIESGNKGKTKVVYNKKKEYFTELEANEIFDEEKLKGKSVFIFVDDELYDSYIADGDEDMYAKGGEVEKVVTQYYEDYADRS
jgi:predicted ABC-type ATPase